METQHRLMGKRLRELRTILEVPVSEMAAITGLTEAQYLEHEAGSVDSSFTFILRCAERLGVDISVLVSGVSPKLSLYHLTRRDGGMPIRRRAGFEYRHLASHLKNRHAEPFVVKAPAQPEDSPIALSTHSGQEFDFILKGRLKVQLDDKIEVMEAGDSILYDSSQPHGMIAIGDEPCEFLAVVIRGEGEPPAAVEPKLFKPVEVPARKLLYQRFMTESVDSEGHLTGVSFHYPENFNFAYDVIDALAEQSPDKLALEHVDRNHVTRKFTFQDIARSSARAANYLYSLGVRRGDRVLLILKRHYQYWSILPALHRLGAIAVPASNQLQVKDLEYRIASAGITAAIYTSDDRIPEYMAEAAKHSPELKLRVVVGNAGPDEHDYDAEVVRYSDEFPRPPELRAGDPSLMYFSSGTSGYPKMVEHSFTYPLGHIVTARWWQNVQPDGLHFTISDTGWGKAAWGKIYGQWLCECAVFVYDFDRFHAADILEMFREHPISTFCAPPTMYRFFCLEDLSKFDLSRVHYAATAGEALTPEVFNQFYKATGLRIMEGFGQTETTLTVGNLLGMTPKVGSMGKPSPQYPVTLLDTHGRPVGTGEVGEVCIATEAGGVPGLFLGYYRDADRTAETWHDGFYHTGDTAWRDEDGYYWYVGRADDLIKSSGYRIGPFEVESVLMELPYVLECAVVGSPDPVRGQVVKAFIVLTAGTVGSDALVKEIQEYVKHNTAPYKYPRKVEFMDALPKTTSGKIRRTALRDLEK